MAQQQEILDDPAFQELLKRRSRMRWTLTGILVGAYLAYGLAGLYAPDALARPFFGAAMTWGLVLGYGIILLGICLSLFYVRYVNRIIAPLQARLGQDQS